MSNNTNGRMLIASRNAKCEMRMMEPVDLADENAHNSTVQAYTAWRIRAKAWSNPDLWGGRWQVHAHSRLRRSQ